MSQAGWMAGVFRQRRHWVADVTRSFQHEYGTTYYAECGAPCLNAADLKRLWWGWEVCAICADALIDNAEWWFGPLQDTVIHARTTDVLAVCGALLAGEATGIAHRYDLSACRSCLAELSE